MHPLHLAAAAAGFVSSVHAQPSLLAETVDAVVDRAVQERRVVGAVVLVAHRGQVVHRRAAGHADREDGRLMREDALFPLASLTKPLVSAATLRLVEQGRLSLDSPVTRWLPSFRPRLEDGSVPTITVHHLLTHTAGLSYGFLEARSGPYRRAGISDGMDLPALTLTENLRRISGVPLAFAPGRGWRYSVALDVLGGVIAAATGQDLPGIVHEQVTGPLGMVDTAFRAADPDRLVTPYQDGRPEPVRMGLEAEVPFGEGTVRFNTTRMLDPAAYPSGGAGMVGTAGDFMRFLLALRGTGEPMLQPATRALMMQDHTGPQAQSQGPGWGFGYGWAVLVDPALAKSPQGPGTIQWGGAYGHSWFFDPVHDVAVVALTNTAMEGMSGRFPLEVRDAVYRGLSLAD